MATLLLRYSLCFDRDGCRFMINRQHACHRIDEQTKMAKAHCACAVWHDSIGERSHWSKWGHVRGRTCKCRAVQVLDEKESYWEIIKLDRLQTQFSVCFFVGKNFFGVFWAKRTILSDLSVVTCRKIPTSDLGRDKWPLYWYRTRQVPCGWSRHTDTRDLSQRKLSHDMSDFFRYTGHLSILTQILSVIENIS